MPLDQNDPVAIQGLASLGGYDPNPKNWGPIYQSAGKQYNVPPKLLEAVIQHESGGNVLSRGTPVNGQQAEGATQMMPPTSASAGVSPWNPTEAIPAAAKMLRSAYDAGGGSWDFALKNYFAGPDQSKWGPQTAQYPSQVYGEFKKLGGQPQDLGVPNQAPKIIVRANGPTSGEPPQPDLKLLPAPATSAAAPVSDKYAGDPVAQQALKLLAPQPAPQVAGLPGLVPGAQPASQPVYNANQPASPGTSAFGNPTAPIVNLPMLQQLSGLNPLNDEWNAGKSALNGLTLGALPYIRAGIAGGANALGSAIQGQSDPMAAGADAYQAKLAQWQQNQGAYKLAHPWTDAAAELGGMTPTLAMGSGLIGSGLRGVNSAIGAAGAPELASALNTAGDWIGGSAGTNRVGMGGVAQRMGSLGLQGAAQGYGSGLATSLMGNGTPEQQGEWGAKAGMILNPTLGMAAIPLERTFNAITTKALAKTLASPEAEATGLRPGQVAQGSWAKTVDKYLGSTKDTEQAVNFNKEFARLTRVPGEELTQESIKDGLQINGKRIGAAIDKIGKLDVKLPIPGGKNYFDALEKLATKMQISSYLNQDDYKPILVALHKMVTDGLTGINGDVYLEMTEHGGVLSDLMQDKFPPAQNFARAARKILDDTLDATAQARGTPESFAELKDARNAYKALIAIQDLPVNSKNHSGVLSPPDVAKLVGKAYDNPEAAGELGRLAMVGNYLSKIDSHGDTSKPISTYAMRWMTHYLPELMGLTGGLGMFAHGGMGPLGAAVAGVGVAGLGHGVGRGLENVLAAPWYRSRMAQFNLGQAPGLSMATPSLGVYPGMYTEKNTTNPMRGRLP